MPTFIEQLRAKLQAKIDERTAAKAELDKILEAPAAEQRDLTDDEQSAFTEKRDQVKALDAEIDALHESHSELADIEQRNHQASQAGAGRPPVTVRSEPMVYGRGSRHSYFLDMARDALGQGDGDGGIGEARERLQRHAAELRVELPAREARRDAAAAEQADHMGRGERWSDRQRESVFEKRVAPNRTDGQGGFFVPPLWIIDEYVDLPRFGRATANVCRNMTLPGGTDSINLPKVATGTTAAIQTADGGTVSSTDLTDTSVSAPVRTIAGQQDIALQLLDQSPVSFDEVVFADLIADYNAKLDVQVINGSGASGQMAGILGVSGLNAVTYTDASPTLPELWVPLLQSASLVAKNRKLGPTAVLLTPSMWYWALSALDTSNRPLVQAFGEQAYNVAAISSGAVAEGPAGVFAYGLPAVLDGNIPSNLGGGTNETRIITARTSDLYLWEGSMRSRVLAEVLSGTLQVRLQVYNYAAFMGNRRPESISVISGTGVIPVAGF